MNEVVHVALRGGDHVERGDPEEERAEGELGRDDGAPYVGEGLTEELEVEEGADEADGAGAREYGDGGHGEVA